MKSLTNFTLLVGKYFIYKCFLNEKSLDFKLYKLQLCEKSLTEEFIATDTIIDFNKKWQPFISSSFISCTFWFGRTPITLSRITIIVISTTSSNQRLGSAFNDLDPRLALFVMSSAPAKKSAGDARCASQDPSTQRCPIKSWLKSVLGVCPSFVECN